MAFNPLVSQGTLNRLRASVNILDFPELNVTAPFLGKEAIRLALEGDTTTYIPTMTGAVTSGEPYQMCSVTIHLLKTQSISDLYKRQMETLSVIGDIVVTPDSSALSPYPILNSSIRSVQELNFSGEDAGYAVTLGGYYLINSELWDQQ